MQVQNVLHENYLLIERNIKKIRRRNRIEIGVTVARQMKIVTRKRKKKIEKKMRKKSEKRRKKKKKGQRVRRKVQKRSETIHWK